MDNLKHIHLNFKIRKYYFIHCVNIVFGKDNLIFNKVEAAAAASSIPTLLVYLLSVALRRVEQFCAAAAARSATA